MSVPVDRHLVCTDDIFRPLSTENMGYHRPVTIASAFREIILITLKPYYIKQRLVFPDHF